MRLRSIAAGAWIVRARANAGTWIEIWTGSFSAVQQGSRTRGACIETTSWEKGSGMASVRAHTGTWIETGTTLKRLMPRVVRAHARRVD